MYGLKVRNFTQFHPQTQKLESPLQLKHYHRKVLLSSFYFSFKKKAPKCLLFPYEFILTLKTIARPKTG